MTPMSRLKFVVTGGLVASCTVAFGQEPENSVVFRYEDQSAAACFVWDYVDWIEDTRSPFFILCRRRLAI